MTAYTELLLPLPKQRFVDNNGNALVGGKVYQYAANSSTPKDTWSDPTANTLNENPLTLDARGECIMYGDGNYRLVVNDAAGNLIYDEPTQGYQAPTAFLGQVNFECVVDGDSLSTGVCGDDRSPFDTDVVVSITDWTVQSIGAASAEFDVWVAPFVAGSPPTISDSIVASAPPTLTSSESSTSSTLTGWQVTIPARAAIRYNLNSLSGLTHGTLTLRGTVTPA